MGILKDQVVAASADATIMMPLPAVLRLGDYVVVAVVVVLVLLLVVVMLVAGVVLMLTR